MRLFVLVGYGQHVRRLLRRLDYRQGLQVEALEVREMLPTLGATEKGKG